MGAIKTPKKSVFFHGVVCEVNQICLSHLLRGKVKRKTIDFSGWLNGKLTVANELIFDTLCVN